MKPIKALAAAAVMFAVIAGTMGGAEAQQLGTPQDQWGRSGNGYMMGPWMMGPNGMMSNGTMGPGMMGWNGQGASMCTMMTSHIEGRLAYLKTELKIIEAQEPLWNAEGQLGSWRNSPLRPLLEEAVSGISRTDLEAVAAELDKATKTLEAFPTIKTLEDDLRAGITYLSGRAHDIDARLRFAPSDPLRLFRSIAMFIDNGRRGIADASLGSANVALLALKLAEFSWRRKKNERNFSLLCIEEPEAHLHPQLQRSVFKKLLGDVDASQAMIVTSHSPTLAAVTPLRSMVQLKRQMGTTHAFSLANLPATPDEIDDLETYLDATRAEVLFARGVIFVEGDAEEALLPIFAKSLSHSLDELGITVCNVGGVNFRPYVKLAEALKLPYCVITDWDPLDGSKPPLG